VVSSHGRFVWYELMTTDMEAAKAFYTAVMGWGARDAGDAGDAGNAGDARDARDASAPDTAYTLFTVEAAPVSGLMELPQDARKMGGKPTWVGYVGVNDVDAAAERIKRLGGAVYVPPTDIRDICRFSVFADPQTAMLALLQWLRPGHEQPAEPAELDASGRVGWHELLAADWEKAFAFYGELFGWQKADAHIGEMGTYQLFSAAGQIIGGMYSKPPMAPVPFWLYYFNVGDIDAAAQRVKAGGGQILHGPFEVPGGSCIVHCTDPQGAIFALEGARRNDAIGYFERIASRDASNARGRRWSW
jgi:uncharacterized protein